MARRPTRPYVVYLEYPDGDCIEIGRATARNQPEAVRLVCARRPLAGQQLVGTIVRAVRASQSGTFVERHRAVLAYQSPVDHSRCPQCGLVDSPQSNELPCPSCGAVLQPETTAAA